MKYLCLFYEEEAILNEMSPEEWQSLRAEVLEYVGDLQSSGRLLSANPLQSATQSSMVRVRNGAVSVTDGPFAETKEQIGGYILIDVADREEALRIAAGWPSARFGSVEVRPVDEELRSDGRYRRLADAAARP